MSAWVFAFWMRGLLIYGGVGSKTRLRIAAMDSC